MSFKVRELHRAQDDVRSIARWLAEICRSAAIVTCIAVGPTVNVALARDPAALTKDQVAFIGTLLERNARNSADAGFLLCTLYREPGDLLNQGWDKFGRGGQWLDWWLVLRPKPCRPLDRNDYFTFIECCDESEMKAVAGRPGILDRIVHAHFYLQGIESGLHPRKEPIPFDEVKEAWFDWRDLAYVENQRTGETDFILGFYDSDARRVPTKSNELSTALSIRDESSACRITPPGGATG